MQPKPLFWSREEANVPEGATARGDTSRNLTVPKWEGAGGAEMEGGKEIEHSSCPIGTC